MMLKIQKRRYDCDLKVSLQMSQKQINDIDSLIISTINNPGSDSIKNNIAETEIILNDELKSILDNLKDA